MPESLREQLERSVRPAGEVPVDAIVARGDHLTRRRRMVAAGATIAGLAVIVAGGVAALGGGSGSTRVVGPPAATAPPTSGATIPSTVPAAIPSSSTPGRASTSLPPSADPAATLPAAVGVYVRLHGPDVVSAGPATTSAGAFAAVSYNVAVSGQGTHPHVAVLSFAGGVWSPVADLTLDIGGVVQPPATHATPIAVVAYTQAATPDFAVTVSYNAGPAIALISRVGGTWHAVTFSAPGRPDVDEVLNPTLGAATIAAAFNTCVPDCAAGNMQHVTYRYSAPTGTMVGG